MRGYAGQVGQCARKLAGNHLGSIGSGLGQHDLAFVSAA